ncbi:MAG: phosphatase PAP2 family protein [Bacteroidales bacterium]|nr:phosphatase PAP2 family protein [Candidatus Cacconaster merdequi]
MKHLVCLFSALVLTLSMSAQTINAVPDGGRLLDAGLFAFRQDAFPQYGFKADEYLQYAPAAAMVTLKAFGVTNRSTWGNMILSSAFSAGISEITAFSLKYALGRERPDKSENTSFPSGHTVKAFTAATVLQKEYGWKYPWIGFCGYATASAVGFSRILNNKHWGTDVLAGALVGIVSGEVGYLIGDLIFKEKGHTEDYRNNLRYGMNCFQLSEEADGWHPYYEIGVYMATAVSFRSRSIQCSSAASTTNGILASIPFARHFGASLKVGARGTQYLESVIENKSSYEAMAGVFGVLPLIRRSNADIHLNFGIDGGKMLFESGVSYGFRITDNYTVKLTGDYRYCINNYSAIMLGGGATFCF